MENLTFTDIQSLNQSIQGLYALDDLDTFGADALVIVNQLVPSEIPEFHITYVRERFVDATFLPDFPGFTPEIIAAIVSDFDSHPVTQHMPQALDGAYKISDFMKPQELYSLEGLYQQFLRPLAIEDQMVFFLPIDHLRSWQQLSQDQATLTGFALHRSERSFTERDRCLLDLLRPHIFQAYSNTQQHHRLQQEFSQLQESTNALGLIILNVDGQVQLMTSPAIVLLAKYFPPASSAGRIPDDLWLWVKHQVANMSANVELTPTCLPLQIEQAKEKLVIRLVVKKSENQYLLSLDEQATSILNSLESLGSLGLSPRETMVLAGIIQGQNNQEIADRMGVARSTVRKHLENIYPKFGVQSREEAIAAALRKLGFLA
jgi:DNA-binding CsgD family transcriptional regulator